MSRLRFIEVLLIQVLVHVTGDWVEASVLDHGPLAAPWAASRHRAR